MTRDLRMLALSLGVLAVAGCAQPRLTSSGNVSQYGEPSASVGVDAGRVGAGVNTDGRVSASADVIEKGPADVDVGVSTAGASASVGLDGIPVRVGIGAGGWRVGW